MLNWLDTVIVLLFAGAVVLEAKRGFGRAIFDFAAVLVAVKFAPMVAEPMSKSFNFTASASANEAWIYAVTFVLMSAVLILLGKFVYDTTLISAETFDALLGGLAGIGIAIVLCHALVRALSVHAGSPEMPSDLVNASAFGTEFLRFDSYHQLMETLYNFHRPDPEI